MKQILVVFLILLFCLPVVSFAYEAVEVKNGGSIKGMVMFAGATIPKDETLTISSDTKFCGKTLPAEKYLINSDRKVKNVVVYIEKIGKGKPVPDAPLVVDNLKCTFVPHISVGVKGKKIIVKNSDALFHNVHAYLKNRTVYNLGLSRKGASIIKRLRKTGIMEVTCDAHPWMRSYVYVLNHPYATVTNENGEFVIDDIPPGVYNIEAWHEALGEAKIADVKVETGKASKIKLEYK